MPRFKSGKGLCIISSRGASDGLLGGGTCNASPVGDDEKVYVGTGGGPGGRGGAGGGGLFAVKAGASGDVLEDQFWATPALAGGTVILRGVENVYCIKR
jgi:hypothetical protein